MSDQAAGATGPAAPADAVTVAGALLVVLCRPPDAQDSKTRLVADVGPDRAREVYRACLRTVLQAAGRSGADVRVAVAGDPLALAPFVREYAPHADLVRQRGDTFAERQRHEIRRGLLDGYQRVAFMASDLPSIEPEQLSFGLHGLPGQVRLLASHDGGYCLLSSDHDLPELTDVPMSQGDTRDRLVAALRERRPGRPVEVDDVQVPNINYGADLAYATAAEGGSR